MKKLTELRNELKISQTDLAAKIGVSQQTISKYEKGSREPDLATLLNLAHFFNVTTDYLLENSSQKHHEIISTSEEEKELLLYYSQLTKSDKRWIMGQMVDLIKKSKATILSPKAQ